MSISQAQAQEDPLGAAQVMRSMAKTLHTMSAVNQNLLNTGQSLDQQQQIDPAVEAQSQIFHLSSGLKDLSRDFANCLKEHIEEEEEEEEEDIFADSILDKDEDEDEEVGICGDKQPDDATFFEQYDDEDADDLSCNESIEIQREAGNFKDFFRCQKKELKKKNLMVECFQRIEQGIAKAAEPLKQYISQKTNEVKAHVDLYEQAIGGYIRSLELIKTDLYGDDGEDKKGYVKMLKELEGLAFELDNALDRPEAGSTASPATKGLALKERMRTLQNEAKGELAAKWINKVGKDTRDCFKDTPQACSDRGSQKPRDCYETLLCKRGTGVSDEASCKFNKKTLDNIFSQFKASETFNRSSQYGILNPDNGKQLEDVINKEYNELKQNFLSSIQISGNFKGAVKVNVIRELAQGHMDNCFKAQTKKFSEAIFSNQVEGNSYLEGLVEYRKEKEILQADLNKWISIVTKNMNEFETRFTKTFQSQILEVKEDCRATNDAATSYECLVRLRNNLNNNLNGTGDTTSIVMHVPTLANKQKDTEERQCRGFKDCINILKSTVDIYQGELNKLENEEKSRVDNHNQLIDNVVSGVGKTFAESLSGLHIGGAVEKINADLAALGIPASILLKDREGESLEKETLNTGSGEKDSGLSIYKVPKNILNVMGTTSGLKKIGSINKVQKAIGTRLEEIKDADKKIAKLKKEAKERFEDCKLSEDQGKLCDAKTKGKNCGFSKGIVNNIAKLHAKMFNQKKEPEKLKVNEDCDQSDFDLQCAQEFLGDLDNLKEENVSEIAKEGLDEFSKLLESIQDLESKRCEEATNGEEGNGNGNGNSNKERNAESTATADQVKKQSPESDIATDKKDDTDDTDATATGTGEGKEEQNTEENPGTGETDNNTPPAAPASAKGPI